MGTLEFPGEEVEPSVPKLAGLSRLLCAAIFDYVSGHSIAGALRFENFYVGKTMFIAASAITSSRCASRLRIYSENDDANCIRQQTSPNKSIVGACTGRIQSFTKQPLLPPGYYLGWLWNRGTVGVPDRQVAERFLYQHLAR